MRNGCFLLNFFSGLLKVRHNCRNFCLKLLLFGLHSFHRRFKLTRLGGQFRCFATFLFGQGSNAANLIKTEIDVDSNVLSLTHGSDTLDTISVDIDPWVFGIGAGIRF